MIISQNLLKGKLLFGMLILSLEICDCEYVKTEAECWKNIKVYSPVLYPEYHMKTIPAKEPGSIRIFYAGVNASTSTSTSTNIAYQYIASAATMAFIEFCRLGLDSGMENQKFEYIMKDDGCNPTIGIPAILEMKEAGADIILGLSCSKVLVPGGYYLRLWNIPSIALSGSLMALNNKDIYNTLIRMGMTFKYVGPSFVEVMKKFHFQTISVLFTEKYWLCDFSIPLMYEELKKNKNITVTEYTRLDHVPNDQELLTYLRNFNERSRVLLVCLERREMVRLLEIAYDLGMVTPEYVYFTVNTFPSVYNLKPWLSTEKLDNATILKRRAAFAHVKIITFPDNATPADDKFRKKVSEKMSEYPWFDNTSMNSNITGSPYAVYLYDAMWFYLTALNKSISNGLDPTNGTSIVNGAKNLIFHGVSGEVIMDKYADRMPNYLIWQIKPQDEEFTKFAYLRIINDEGKRIIMKEAAYWGTLDGEPPPDKPICGYINQLCLPSTQGRDTALITGFTLLALVIMTALTAILIYRKKKFDNDVYKMSWKISKEDIEFSVKNAGGSGIGMSLQSIRSNHSKESRAPLLSPNKPTEQTFSKVGLYKGALCAIKVIQKTDCRLNREQLVHLKHLKDANHENINQFIGASIDPPNLHIFTSYCAKGSLQDILEHDEIKLDWMFKCSLIYDLVHGLNYIHNSQIISHGSLTSGNCLIDSRWVLKINNTGLQSIKRRNVVEQYPGEYLQYKRQLWTAPELLRMAESERPLKGTQKGDIYSLAVILQEVLFRELPYFMGSNTPKEIIENVAKVQDPPFRPPLPLLSSKMDLKMVELMKDCWHEIPSERPDMRSIDKKLKQINGRKVNILDSMVKKLEKYSNNLEEIVEHRTEELLAEKKKTDNLLYRMLPLVVAEKLKNGVVIAPEIFSSVSIYFSDIVGFTAISSDSGPMEVVNLLNDLYTLFDDIIGKHDVYKVETIGDAYMCVSGCPNRNGEEHAVEIANMSIAIRESVDHFKIRHMPERQLKIRIGMHSGSCAAGVVGLKMPRYCLFGDTVNMASRMESTGESMKIHVSEDSYGVLAPRHPEYVFACRGRVSLKGKGLVTSYWLEGVDKVH